MGTQQLFLYNAVVTLCPPPWPIAPPSQPRPPYYQVAAPALPHVIPERQKGEDRCDLAIPQPARRTSRLFFSADRWSMLQLCKQHGFSGNSAAPRGNQLQTTHREQSGCTPAKPEHQNRQRLDLPTPDPQDASRLLAQHSWPGPFPWPRSPPALFLPLPCSGGELLQSLAHAVPSLWIALPCHALLGPSPTAPLIK